MEVITCYTVQIEQQGYVTSGSDKNGAVSWRAVNDSLMKSTSDICLEALHSCVDICLLEWEHLKDIPTSAKPGEISRKRAVDILIHSTKGSPAKYLMFDERFPDMPSYMRRAIIADALGMVSSYKSNHKNWESQSASERGSGPTLGFPSRYELTFYEQERDICDIENGIIGLKLYNGRVWEWYRFRIALSDARYINRMRSSRQLLSPVVEKIRGRYRIRFSFKENKTLVPDKDPLGYTILAVDLGINAAASWCVMTADGTVHARGVIHLPCEEGRLRRLIDRKRMYQQSGKKPHGIYRMVTAANRALSIETCRRLEEIAVLYNTDCIVFEHLDRPGRVRGKSYRERIRLWRANDVQTRMETKAHRLCMRISRVCAWGTSKYAFDDSGAVIRDKENYSVCTFQNGKRYNCDLSAALNIGARYFLRIMANMPKPPELPKTPLRTYATLVSVLQDAA